MMKFYILVLCALGQDNTANTASEIVTPAMASDIDETDSAQSMREGETSENSIVQGELSSKSVENTQQKSRTRKLAKKKRRKRCVTTSSPRYRKMVRSWQKPPSVKKPQWRDGFRDVVMYSVNHGDRIRVFPFLPDGSLDPDALNKISLVLRDKKTDSVKSVAPRLVKLLYRLALQFEATQITVISGYREPLTEEEGGSHHSDGSAIDFTIPGVRLASVAKEARKLGHVGVGYYPTSGFVHLDVRDGPSYFWVDRSGPGQAGCLFRIMTQAGWKYDSRWKQERDEPEPEVDKQGNLLGEVLPDKPEIEPKIGGLPTMPPNP